MTWQRKTKSFDTGC